MPARGLAALADDLDDLGADRVEVDAEGFEAARGDAFALVDQPEQDVLGTDVVVVEEARLLLSEYYNSSGSVSKPFKHVVSIPKKRSAPLWWRLAEYSPRPLSS